MSPKNSNISIRMEKIKVGITHGDFNGISYEIIIKTLLDSRLLDLCTPVVYGSARVAGYYKGMMPEAEGFSFNVITDPEQANPKRANMIVCVDENVKIEPGQPTVVSGQYAIASLNAAVRDLKAGKIDVLVTCPINKKNTTGDDFGFIGHTEYLAAQFGDAEPLMFMVSDTLRVGLVTMHMPLVRVPGAVTTEAVLEHIRALKRSLERDFRITGPKIAVLGLNPHAGDDGLLGTEEREIIIPAIQSAKYENILAFGPFAADGFFGSGAYRKFDAVLAMYHDQGLAPFKALTFADGVNFTAGLSVVRTSPAHGVGFDIAGKMVADPAPMRAAIYRAIDIYRNRQVFDAASADPLQHFSKNDRNERGGGEQKGGGRGGNRRGNGNNGGGEGRNESAGRRDADVAELLKADETVAQATADTDASLAAEV